MTATIDSRIVYVTVEHSYYGCETGCCGWIAYAYDKSGNKLHESDFTLIHAHASDLPEEQQRKEVQEFAEIHFPNAPINWDESDYRCTN